MTAPKRKRDRKWLEWLTVLTFVCVPGWYFFLKPPSLRRADVASVKISFMGKDLSATISAEAECAKFYKLLKRARPRGDHKCTTTGSIMLHYKDGTMEAVGILSDHGSKHYDLRHDGKCYYVPRDEFFSVLNSAGLDTSKLSTRE
jgi:hypothetical protein